MRLSKNSLTWMATVAVGALAWLSPLPALAGDNVWTGDGSPSPNITGVALDPADARTIYAVSESGIFKSVDGGATWSGLGEGDAALMGLTCLAVDPAHPSNVYAGTSNGIVANSHDAGATWSKVAVGATPVTSIAVEPATGSVYAATRSSPLQRSTDGGKTWISAGLPGSDNKPRPVYALLADSLQQTLFVGTSLAYTSGHYAGLQWVPKPGWSGAGVASTTNAGVSWTLPATDLGSLTALASDPSSGLVYAGTSSEILRSTDGGTNWSHLGQLGYATTIVVDPSSASTLYATTGGSVSRSLDGGATWRPFDFGLYPSATSLAIDPEGRTLYAGTAGGVFHREISAGSAARACQPGADHLCLLGTRFRVDLYATDPRTQVRAPIAAIAQADRFGYFSFPTLTGDASLPEVFVKMLDATSLPGQGYWVFTSSLTDVPYRLFITDTATGLTQDYDGQAFCGTADIQSFPPGASSGGAAAVVSANAALAASGGELALLSHRFRLTLSATDPSTGTTASGVAIPQGDRFGYFSLPAFTGDSTFPEVFVKMLDATSLQDNDFWLFHTGLTNLRYTLRLLDSKTGAVKYYYGGICGGADVRVSNPDLSGTWTGTYTTNDSMDCSPVPLTAQATFGQWGETVLGSLTANGPCGVNLQFTGTLEGQVLNGSLSAPSFGGGTATGTITGGSLVLTLRNLDNSEMGTLHLHR